MDPVQPKTPLSQFHLIPWTTLLLVFMVGCHTFNVNLSMGSVMSTVAVLASVIVLVLEFLRSGDIQLKKFIWDTTLSLFSLVAGTWYVANLVLVGSSPIFFVDYLMYAVIVLDSWLSPINAFRTSLRNFQLGGQ